MMVKSMALLTYPYIPRLSQPLALKVLSKPVHELNDAGVTVKNDSILWQVESENNSKGAAVVVGIAPHPFIDFLHYISIIGQLFIGHYGVAVKRLVVVTHDFIFL